ncbi:lytic murein transglycosylase [Desulfobacterales bacterium HSG17]|nr:lytic murein transglycosylase [Desulfobacterales bacterium HSG17]
MKNNIKHIIYLGILFLFTTGGISPAAGISADKRFDFLTTRLIADGHGIKRIKELYGNPKLKFKGKLVAIFLRYSEGSLDYNQFLSASNIAKAKNYMAENATIFQTATARYAVPAEFITAIILIETQLGGNVGRSPVLACLSTLASISEPTVRKGFYDSIKHNSRLHGPEFEAWADRKSAWAYEEVKAFLVYTEKGSQNPLLIKGSFAGAMGLSQFMPSNILKYGADGNEDGRVDLFIHEDAIMSVASYLAGFGWVPDLSFEAKQKVIWEYNHSTPYVETVFKIAERLIK